MDIEVVTVELGNEFSKTGTSNNNVVRPGVIKVLWRNLDVEVMPSEVIPNGVNVYSE
ncbi:MAG: hypothetical protein MJZ66_06980 [Bacteroidales bacterium]|nr:hypothetical protein [Bacteroidales bacterium]